MTAASGEWVLIAGLPGMAGRRQYGDSPGRLKPHAERWLLEFAAALGVVFPDAPDARWQALKDYLADAIEADAKKASPIPTQLADGWLTVRLLSKMSELEAGQ